MAEYIEKEPVLKTAKELQGGSFAAPLIVEAIEKAPAVEIVRCANCVHWDGMGYKGRCVAPINGLIWENTNYDDFCSYAKMKGGAE